MNWLKYFNCNCTCTCNLFLHSINPTIWQVIHVQHSTYKYTQYAYERVQQEHLSWWHLTTIIVQYYQSILL